nr:MULTISPECIES: hypothetical protein [Brevundimonas]
MINQSLRATLHFGQLSFCLASPQAEHSSISLGGDARFLDGDRYSVRGQKPVLDGSQNTSLDLGPLDAATIGANRFALLPAPRAHESLRVSTSDHAATANTAGQLAA